MKVSDIRLQKEPYKSFIVHIEKDPFTPWHHHPEYEIVLIMKGRGRRMVGDNVARFSRYDLVFLGPFIPHKWVCEPDDDDIIDAPQNEAFVIQFNYDFLGNKFFEIPEHASLKRFLIESSRGFEIYGKTKSMVISILHKMISMNDVQRLYALINIFEIFGNSTEYHYLANPSSNDKYSSKGGAEMKIAMQYILENFQRKIQVEELLSVTNMSYASFYLSFKKAHQMPFKDYLLHVRVGYACRLLTEKSMNISEVAYASGFENLANFNRQFKRLKGITPTHFQKQYVTELIPEHISTK